MVTESRMNFDKKSFFVLFIIIILTISLAYVNAYPEIEKYEYYEKDDINAHVEGDVYQQHVVYSNYTNKFYSFYTKSDSASNGLYYDVLNYDGSVFDDNNIIGTDVMYQSAPYRDFDVRIDKFGVKIYLWFADNNVPFTYESNKDVLYCIYFGLNNETLKPDLLSINQVWNKANYVRGYVRGAITGDGYPIVSFQQRLGDASSSWAIIIVSDSDTNFNPVYNVSMQKICQDLTGVATQQGVGTNMMHPIISYKDSGMMFVSSSYNPTNKNHERIFSAFCVSLNKVSYNSGDWDYEWINSDFTLYDDIYPRTWDLINNYNDNIMFIWNRNNHATNILRTWIFDVPTTEWVNATNHRNTTYDKDPTFITVNSKGDFALIEARNITDNCDFYIKRYYQYNDSWIPFRLLWEYSSLENESINWFYIVLSSSQIMNFPDSNKNSCPIIIDGVGVPTDDFYIGFFSVDNNTFPPLPINYIKLDGIENNIIEDYGIIILPDTEHEIEFNVFENTTYVYSVIDNHENIVTFGYNLTSNEKIINVVNTLGLNIKNIGYIKGVTETDNDDNITIKMVFVLNDNVLDYYSQILDYGIYYNDEWYNLTSTIKYSVFNEGGIPSYTSNGDGSVVPYDDILAIQATGDGSWEKVEVLYNKLQHMHFLVTFDVDGDWDTNHWTNLTGGFFEYGVDYQHNGTFLNGWKVRIYPSSFNVGHYGLGVDYNWIQWTIEHYNYNKTTSVYDLLKEDILYSNFNGYDSEQSDKGYINNTSTSFWVDLWFSNEYSSSKVGTRVNSEYFGMYEQGSSFWFGYGAFRPMFGNETLSLFFDNVYDSNSEISTVRNNVELVKFWGRVEKVTGGDKTYKMYRYSMKNKIQAFDNMVGVDIPALVETKVIDMPQSGFLTPLVKIISSIGDMFKNALIAVLWYIIGAIDSILETFGLPSGFMTTMIDWVILQASVIFTWMGLVAQYAEDILYIFVSFANTVISFMGYIIAGITWIIIWVLPIPIHIVTFVIAIFTSGVWVYGGYTWDFSSYSAITDAFWSIMPIIITWVFMLWLFMGDDDDIGGFPKRLVQTFTFIKDAYNDIFWIYTRMANSIISMYNFIRSHIPFLSSGGGEQDEG